MKILIILTGGTICSAKNESGLNALSTEAASLSLVSMFREREVAESDVEFESISPINTLSENMTIDKWNQLIGALKKIDYSQYAGIMILHGTDTLHLTAALMGVLLGDIGCPVMMVSAHRILDDPESNGVDNFTKSVELIKRLHDDGKGGVYVVFRNMDGVSYVHHATHLEECGDYSEEFFSSDMIEYEKLISEWSKEQSDEWLSLGSSIKQRIKIERKTHSGYSSSEKTGGGYSNNEKTNSENTIGERTSILDIGTLSDSVLYIRPYVGINYDRISLDGVKAVLHGMYHSSTINTEGDGPTSALSLLKRCNEKGIAFYIFPCKDGEYRYSTTKPLIDAGAKCLYGGTWEEAYVRLLLEQ